jgi:hypothetical protein
MSESLIDAISMKTVVTGKSLDLAVLEVVLANAAQLFLVARFVDEVTVILPPVAAVPMAATTSLGVDGLRVRIRPYMGGRRAQMPHMRQKGLRWLKG